MNASVWFTRRGLLGAGAALALAGLVGPLLAAVLMPASSLSVVLSSALSRPFPAPARRPARAVSTEA